MMYPDHIQQICCPFCTDDVDICRYFNWTYTVLSYNSISTELHRSTDGTRIKELQEAARQTGDIDSDSLFELDRCSGAALGPWGLQLEFLRLKEFWVEIFILRCESLSINCKSNLFQTFFLGGHHIDNIQ